MLRHYTTFNAKLDAQSAVSFTDEGFMVVPATLTRVGVFDYPERNRRELRHPDEVFSKASMDSLIGKSVTLFHPSEMVTPQNVRDLEVGQIVGPIERQENYLKATLIIKDGDTIEFLKNARLRKEDVKVSCGYWAEDDPTPGEWEGEKYDVVQRNIRYNHVAIGVNNPRAGGNAKLSLDNKEKGGRKMKVELKAVRLDGVLDLPAVTVETDKADEVVNTLKERNDALESAFAKMRDEHKKRLDEMQAKLDAAEEKEKELQKTIDALSDINGDHVKSMVELRRTLDDAAATLGIKLDGLSVRDAKVAVIEKVFEKKMDGKSDDYIAAMYDSALDVLNARKNAENMRRVVGDSKKPEDAPKSRQQLYDEIHNKNNK